MPRAPPPLARQRRRPTRLSGARRRPGRLRLPLPRGRWRGRARRGHRDSRASDARARRRRLPPRRRRGVPPKVFDDHPRRSQAHARVPIRVGLLARPRAVHPAAHPAADYFPEAQYRELESTLLTFAREQLGCAGITPVWLSCYVDGCRQELTPTSRTVPGRSSSPSPTGKRANSPAETLILKPETLDYWRGFDADAVVERESLARLVGPDQPPRRVRSSVTARRAGGGGRARPARRAIGDSRMVQRPRAALHRGAHRGGERNPC